MNELDMLLEDILLEAEEDELDTDDLDTEIDEEDNNQDSNKENDKEEPSKEEDKEENKSEEENNEDEEQPEEDNKEDENKEDEENPETTSDDNSLENPDDNNEEPSDNDDLEPPTEEETKVDKETLLIYFDHFKELYTLTENFLEKINDLKESVTTNEERTILIVVEGKLTKQKIDLSYLLTKKISSMEEKNLKQLLVIFKTKIETLVDIIKSTFKDNKPINK